jgi:DSF synthase
MGAFDFALPIFTEHVGTERVSLEFDGAAHALWITMSPGESDSVHNFSMPLLREMTDMVHTLETNGSTWMSKGRATPVHYAVMRSGHPDYFNLGGDLSYFRSCIRDKNKAGLLEYSTSCMDLLYRWSTVSSENTTTIALVQGRALGGGFEAVLSADHIVAEEQSTFGFPEIMFGLFPCTGGMSLLARRIGAFKAEKMLTSGKTYSAAELLEMGVIDEICPTGLGEVAVEKFIGLHSRRRESRLMVQRSRNRIAPLDYAELAKVVDEWVDLALRLGEEELRMMDMLIMMQRGSAQQTQLKTASA